MIINEIRDQLNDNAIVFENPSFDKSIIAYTENGNAIYSYEKMIEEMAEEDNISHEEAEDFICYNTIRALDYMQNTMKPIIAYDIFY